MKIKDLISNNNIIVFLLVRNMEESIDRNNNPYIKFSLSDGRDDIDAFMWGAKKENLEPGIETGKIIKVKATVKNQRNRLQLIIQKIRLSVPDDDIDEGSFIKKAPVSSEDMLRYILDEVNKFQNIDLKKLVIKLLDDNKDKLLYYPAAKTVHHAVKGGLLYHIYRMLKNGINMAEIYNEYVNRDLLLSGIIIHDIGKINEIESNNLGIADDYSKEGKLLGHIVQGTIMLHDVAKELNISDEVELLLKHMIVSHHGLEENGSPKKPMILEAELLHHLDEIDANVYQFQDTLRDVSKGEFSERQFFLGNIQIYKNNL